MDEWSGVVEEEDGEEKKIGVSCGADDGGIDRNCAFLATCLAV